MLFMQIHACPVCKSPVTIDKIRKNGGWNENYDDWIVKCGECGLISASFPADNYYGREFFGTETDAIKEWNKVCEKYDSQTDIKKIIDGLNALYDSMEEHQCYACAHEFIDVIHDFGTNILGEAIEFLSSIESYTIRKKGEK